MATIRLSVNGKARSVDTEPERPLLEVLREDLGLTGTKYGCGEGQCGACTVLLDGKPAVSCVIVSQEGAGVGVANRPRVQLLIPGIKPVHVVPETLRMQDGRGRGICRGGRYQSAENARRGRRERLPQHRSSGHC